MWNTRYFVLPICPRRLEGRAPRLRGVPARTPSRSIPRRGQFAGPGDRSGTKELARATRTSRSSATATPTPAPGSSTTAQLHRTDHRAWSGPTAMMPMQEILYANDPLWTTPTSAVYDPHVIAWIEVEEARRGEILPFLPGPARGRETVKVADYSPQRVVLDVELDRPGLVVLADIFYPGWGLTIDGTAGPDLPRQPPDARRRRPAGPHRLVYTYEPRSFRVGGGITLAALGLARRARGGVPLRPVSARLASHPHPLAPHDRGDRVGPSCISIPAERVTTNATILCHRHHAGPGRPVGTRPHRPGADPEAAEGRPRSPRAGLGRGAQDALRAVDVRRPAQPGQDDPAGHARPVPQGGPGPVTLPAGDRAGARDRQPRRLVSARQRRQVAREARALVLQVQEHDRGPREEHEPAAAAGRGRRSVVRRPATSRSASGSPTTASRTAASSPSRRSSPRSTSAWPSSPTRR